jgi:hypothetical protein
MEGTNHTSKSSVDFEREKRLQKKKKVGTITFKAVGTRAEALGEARELAREARADA